MRILHITHQYRPAIGGAEQYIVDLSEELVRRGHQVDVFTSRSVDYHSWRNTLPRFEQLDGVNIYRFNSLTRGKLAWRSLRYGFEHYWRTGAQRYEPYIFYGSGPLCPGLFLTLLLRAPHYDLIHINQLHYSHSVSAYVASRLRRIPTIITPHVHTEQHETYDVGYMRGVLRGCQAILTVTRQEKEYLVHLNLNPEIIVGGNSLRLECFPPLDQRESRAHFGLPADAFVMLFLGRKTDYKGLDVCLEAYARLRQLRQDVCFLAVGPETEFSRQLWQKYPGLEGLVVRGAVPDDERLTAFAACDVFAMPSTAEAFGIVYLQAWAQRKPVIAARIAAVSSLVSEREDGFLITPGSVDDLIQCITYLAAHRDTARAMGARGRLKLEKHYTVERIVDVIEGAYRRVIRRQHTHG